MTFACETVDAIRAQLDLVMAAAGWRVSFADHESVQWAAPVAEDLTNHLHPFLVPSVDWFAGDAGQVEATDFDGKMHRAVNVFDLMPWLARQALDERMHDRRATSSRHTGAGEGRGERRWNRAGANPVQPTPEDTDERCL